MDLEKKYSNLYELMLWMDEDYSNTSDIEFLLTTFIKQKKELKDSKLLENIVIDINNLLSEYQDEDTLLSALHDLGLNIKLYNPNARASSDVPSIWLKDIVKRIESEL